MSYYELPVTLADLDTIAYGGTVSATVAPGITIELVSEHAWTGPSQEPGVHRCGLDNEELTWLRVRRTLTILPVGIYESVLLTLAETAVA